MLRNNYASTDLQQPPGYPPGRDPRNRQQRNRQPQRRQPQNRQPYPPRNDQNREPQPETVCTRLCYCQQSQAYCAQKNLRKVPEPWPYGLTSISLDQNQLRSINVEAFAHTELRSVASLTMSVNQLSKIPDNAFSGLTGLRELTLSSNSLTTIEADAFKGLNLLENINLRINEIKELDPAPFRKLRGLRQINLEGNKLETISSDFFDQLPGLGALALADNPWRCDCDLLGLFIWMNSGKQLQGKSPSCWTPEHLQGRTLQGFTFKDFQKICSEDWKKDSTEVTTTSPEIPEVASKMINESCTSHNSSLPVDICFISGDISSSPGRHVCFHCLTTKDERLFDINGSGLEFEDNGDITNDVNVTWEVPDSTISLTEEDGRLVQHDNGSLCIKNVQVKDGGEYVCSAELRNFTVFETVNLNVTNLPLAMAVGVVVSIFLLMLLFLIILMRWWNEEVEAEKK